MPNNRTKLWIIPYKRIKIKQKNLATFSKKKIPFIPTESRVNPQRPVGDLATAAAPGAGGGGSRGKTGEEGQKGEGSCGGLQFLLLPSTGKGSTLCHLSISEG